MDRQVAARHEPFWRDEMTAVVCLDFDGTLVDEEGRIHPSDVEILANERSVAFVPATGRPLHSVRRTFEQHGLFLEVPIPFPLVLENGAAVYAENEVLLSRRSFEPDLQETLINISVASANVRFLIYSLDEVRLLRPDESLRKMVRRFDLETQPFEPGDEQTFSLSKIAATAGDHETLRAFEARVAELPLERTYSLPDVLELTPVGVHKGDGLLTLLDGAGRDGLEVAVAGDGENDLTLFDLATLTFAPRNSPPAIQARADHVLDVPHEGLLAPILREIEARRAAAT